MPCECCENNNQGKFRNLRLLKESSNYCEDDENAGNEFKRPFPKHFSTLAIHAGQEPELWSTLSVTPNMVTSAIFKQYKPGEPSGFERVSNPSRAVLEDCLSALYKSKYCFCFSSGMAAISACLALLRSGEHIICGDDLYGGTVALMNTIAPSFGISVTFVDCTNAANIIKKVTKFTKLIFIETPTNPCMKVIDIEAVAKIAKARKIYFAVDNTTATVYLQNPLELGADIALDSLSKYSNGHYDCVAGAINTSNEAIGKKLKVLQILMGTAISPYDAHLVSRGLKTFKLRVKRQVENTMQIAKFLACQKRISKVLYPGLPSHPQYEIAKKQMSGFGGILSVILNGSVDDCRRFVSKLKYFTLAVSFGGIQSLIEIPAQMTHSNVSQEHREAAGISDKMIRIAIGIENIEDLIEDLKNGFNNIGGVVGC